MRRSGILYDPGDAELGDHVCFGYASDDDYESRLSSYCAAGLAARQRVMFISPRGNGDRALARLAREHCVGKLIEDRQLEVGAVAAAYTPMQTFDADRRIDGYREAVEHALADGYTGLRVAADATALVTTPGWVEYELRADMLASSMPFTALCAYDRRVADPAALADTEAVHRMSLPPAGSRESALFRVHAGPDGGIAIAGEVDATVVDRLGEVLASGAGVASSPVVDLSGLEFADAAATRVIALAVRDLAGVHGRAVLAGASPLFRRIWEIGGFAEWAPTVELTP